jgi:hypothetical protein
LHHWIPYTRRRIPKMRPTTTPRNQLALFLEPEKRYPLEKETREALIAALADLLLEAYGAEEETKSDRHGGHDER